jgi:hypothetical protein
MSEFFGVAVIRSAIIFCALGLLVACAGTDSQSLGRTPAMVTVCQSASDTWQQVLDVAEEECGQYGRSAEFLARDGDCTKDGAVTGEKSGHGTGKTIHFRCIRNY